jgi:hypothetical protein
MCWEYMMTWPLIQDTSGPCQLKDDAAIEKKSRYNSRRRLIPVLLEVKGKCREGWHASSAPTLEAKYQRMRTADRHTTAPSIATMMLWSSKGEGSQMSLK